MSFRVGNTLNHITNLDKFRGIDTAVLEQEQGGGFELLIFMANMSLQEKVLLQKSKIITRIIKETDSFVLTLIRFGDSPIIFEIPFDPTIYKENKYNQFMKSNIVTIIGVESINCIIQCLAMASLPKSLYMEWITSWTNALKTENFTPKYKAWVQDLDIRYSVRQLWDMGKNTGCLGE